jgi:hypothetical protein
MRAMADVGRLLPHIGPVAIVGNLEAVILREQGVLLVAARFVECFGDFFIVDVGDAFEEQQWEDARLEVGSIDRPAQDVRGFPAVVGDRGEIEFVVGHRHPLRGSCFVIGSMPAPRTRVNPGNG